ncbi:MAG: hypothetical protein E7643_01470 [Ruminococcaceae bacterium]|nr:hypothetical protein [Oscillospiraceae bacterium]
MSVKEKRRVELSDFSGMDFASSPIHASLKRATEGVNWEPRHGVNRKRRGWEQLVDALPARINGMFPYTRESGERELIVYAGTDFYRISLDTFEREPITTRNTVGVLLGGIEDRRCQGFYSNGYLYFVGCGVFLRYGSFGGVYEVRTVDPYIPTTTVGIGCTDTADSARELRDLVNLLTPKRKNTLYGHASAATWLLDGAISQGTAVTVEADVASDTGVDHVVYENSGTDKTKLYNEKGTLSGSISFFEGKISLLNATAGVGDAPNVTVSFTAAEDLFGGVGYGGMSMIYGCGFGTLFGVGGAQDRLFLGGNPEYPNTVFFSERQDFSYFPDQFTAILGTDERAITGFLPLSDSTLAVFKEPHTRESSVYYMSGEYRSFYSEEGDLKKTIPVFSVCAAGAGESLVSPYAAVSLAGDPLILSKNGVFGIEYTDNVVSNARVTRARSHTVAPRLCAEEGLSEAVAVTQGDRLYLAVGDHCYVADRRYRYRDGESGDAEYEWWYWDHIPARVFSHVGEEIWFGTGAGEICRFYEGCIDRSFLTSAAGEFGFHYTIGALSYADSLLFFLQEGRRMTPLTAGIMGEIMKGCHSIAHNKIYAEEAVLARIYEGLPVYAAFFGGTQLSEGRIYYICEIDRTKGCFSLATSSGGRPIALGNTKTSLCLYTELSGRDIYIGKQDFLEKVVYVRLTKEGVDVPLANYFRPVEVGNANRIYPTTPIFRIHTDQNVTATWKTPFLDLGSDLYTKDLFSMIFSAKRLAGEKVVFGYETESHREEITMDLSGGLSLNLADLEGLSLERGYHKSLCLTAKAKGFHSIRFFFSSESAAPTEVYSIGAVYKINKLKKGVVL